MASITKCNVDSDGRECSKCGVYKLWENFSNYKTGLNGKNPGCKSCTSIMRRDYRSTQHNKDHRRAYHIKKTYGISSDTYEDMLSTQNNKCKICYEEFKKTPNVDHDHATGEVRGLLCSKCNRGLGYFNDNKKLLRSAIRYLE